MIPARILGRDPTTGKIFQAMRGEVDPTRWRWIEVTHESDQPMLAGDIVFTFPGGIDTFPTVPPQRAAMTDDDGPTK